MKKNIAPVVLIIVLFIACFLVGCGSNQKQENIKQEIYEVIGDCKKGAGDFNKLYNLYLNNKKKVNDPESGITNEEINSIVLEMKKMAKDIDQLAIVFCIDPGDINIKKQLMRHIELSISNAHEVIGSVLSVNWRITESSLQDKQLREFISNIVDYQIKRDDSVVNIIESMRIIYNYEKSPYNIINYNHLKDIKQKIINKSDTFAELTCVYTSVFRGLSGFFTIKPFRENNDIFRKICAIGTKDDWLTYILDNETSNNEIVRSLVAVGKTIIAGNLYRK